jgi:hypothetical protein
LRISLKPTSLSEALNGGEVVAVGALEPFNDELKVIRRATPNFIEEETFVT